MKIVGLITEYNPFHNGHLYHIQEARRVTGADAVIVVMSGDYVQRGTPAIMPKRLRTEMALRSGASAVFELPVCYATASAQLFAEGAVSLLDKLQVVDSVCFGTECGDPEALGRVADILGSEPPEYSNRLREHLKEGCSFPLARQRALEEYLPDKTDASLLAEPNNLLGIEYLRALKKLKSPLTPYAIRRQGAHYHDKDIRQGSYSSASAIRSLLAYSGSALSTDRTGGTFDNTRFSTLLGELEDQVPPYCLELLKDQHRVSYPIYQNDFSLILKYKLLNKQPAGLMRYMDVSEELANRISVRLDNFFNYKQFCELLKTRELTQTRINRALLHIMLGLKKSDVKEYVLGGYHYYAKLLGVRKDREKLLPLIARESPLTLLVRQSDGSALTSCAARMLRNDLLASNLYASVVTDRYKTAFQNEYRQALIKV